VQFTPAGGTISLHVEEAGRDEHTNTVRFTVKDTGIGMTEEQISRLFNAFEQADGSVSRKYGGTGLGLVISKKIVEKMCGEIWVESELDKGSSFIFDVVLERSSHQDTIIFDGIRPEDIRVLIIEADDDIRRHFLNLTNKFGIHADSAENTKDALALVDKASAGSREYDIVFLDYDMPGTSCIDFVNELSNRVSKNTVIIITTYLEWSHIEDIALENNLTHYIMKPLFPSSILDAINEVVGDKLKKLDIKTDKTPDAPDLSDLYVLLAEDVDINREIFITLLEDTKIRIDSAENGKIAVAMFRENPDKYDLIIMDIQMPEMDGYQATMAIRAMQTPQAKTIPIIAMTANAFKEDVDRCIESGMNDHLAKPIDEKAVIEKIISYTRKD